jgi:hypothetical protein
MVGCENAFHQKAAMPRSRPIADPICIHKDVMPPALAGQYLCVEPVKEP